MKRFSNVFLVFISTQLWLVAPFPASAGLQTSPAIDQSSWTTYTPTVTSALGTITTSSATGAYKVVGKTVHFTLSATITTNGTGSSAVRATLPFTASNRDFTGGGDDAGNTDKGVWWHIQPSSTYLRIKFYDGTYPGSNTAVLVMSGSYESI